MKISSSGICFILVCLHLYSSNVEFRCNRKIKDSIFDGRLKPDKSLFSLKHASLPVMTYTWAPPREMKNDFIIKKKVSRQNTFRVPGK